MALRLRAFQADVAYFSRHRLCAEVERELGVEYLPFDELLGRSDFVSLHVPLAPVDARAVCGERGMGSRRPSAVLINTSRGAAVDQAELASALESGGLAGAGLDVLDPESPDASRRCVCRRLD